MDDTRFTVSVHIVTAMAYRPDELVTSPTLAKSICTNPIVVRRLVSRLVEHGLVVSFRGKAGGLRLARRPEEITLRDIYEASTERPIVAVPAKPAQKECAVSCSMKKILGEVVRGLETATLDYLGKIRVSELVAKVPRAR